MRADRRRSDMTKLIASCHKFCERALEPQLCFYFFCPCAKIVLSIRQMAVTFKQSRRLLRQHKYTRSHIPHLQTLSGLYHFCEAHSESRSRDIQSCA